MALIPIEMLEQTKKGNLTPLTQPNKNHVVKKMAEMSSLLRARVYRIVLKLEDIEKN